jgi:hypothetical protein
MANQKYYINLLKNKGYTKIKCDKKVFISPSKGDNYDR